MKRGWQVKRLGELGAAIREQAKIAAEDEYELWSVPSFETGRPEMSFGRDIGSAKLRVRPNDVLICKINPRINRVWLVSEPMHGREQVGSTEWLVFRANRDAGLSPHWLIHFVSAPKFREWIASEVSGATGSHTRAKTDGILQQEIPVPPLPEQQRIVGILDEACEGIATARANAERNLANARALFESYLQSVFTQRGKGWVDTALGHVCGFVRGPFGGSLKKSTFVADGCAVYEQKHAIYDQFEDVRYFINENKFKEMKRFELLPGDLIMSCSGTMGRVAIAPSGLKRGIINQALLKLTPSSRLLNTFLKSWMESESFQDSLKEYSGGAAIQNVASVKILKDIRVPLPSMDDQERVVDKLDALREHTQRLTTLYERKCAALEALKKSLLHEAFSGKL